MEGLIISKVNPYELAELLYVAKQTYFETFFDAFNDPDGFYTYTSALFAPDKLASELSHPDIVFYFARWQGNIAGYIKVNFNAAQSNFKTDQCAEIEHLYILAEYHEKHIGKSLLNRAIEIARNQNLNYVWLSVWENNHKAIRFYERNGFATFDVHHYEIDGDAQRDLLMKRML